MCWVWGYKDTSDGNAFECVFNAEQILILQRFVWREFYMEGAETQYWEYSGVPIVESYVTNNTKT